MEEETKLSLDEFLNQYSFDGSNLSDSEKIKILKTIIFNNSVEKDLEELKYSKIPKEERTSEVTTNYISKIQNLDLSYIQAKGYIFSLQKVNEEKRKLKRKENFKKVLSIFRKRK